MDMQAGSGVIIPGSAQKCVDMDDWECGDGGNAGLIFGLDDLDSLFEFYQFCNSVKQQDWIQESSPDGQGYVGDSSELPHSTVLDCNASGFLLILAFLFLLVTHYLLALFHLEMVFLSAMELLGCTGTEPSLRNHLMNCPRRWTR